MRHIYLTLPIYSYYKLYQYELFEFVDYVKIRVHYYSTIAVTSSMLFFYQVIDYTNVAENTNSSSFIFINLNSLMRR